MLKSVTVTRKRTFDTNAQEEIVKRLKEALEWANNEKDGWHHETDDAKYDHQRRCAKRKADAAWQMECAIDECLQSVTKLCCVK